MKFYAVYMADQYGRDHVYRLPEAGVNVAYSGTGPVPAV